MQYDTNARQFSSTSSYDIGLRDYMISIYKYMAIALMITGIVASVTASSEQLMYTIFTSPLKWVVMLAPLGMVFFLSSKIMTMTIQGARMAFYGFAALMGVSLASIFVIYTGESIARTFLITASVFGAMSLYGYTTKKDLSSMGSFLIMGLFGIIIASVINIFMQSAMIHFVVSILGVLIFTGLTAYDVQRLKDSYHQVSGCGETASKVAIFGALSLYMNFINLFLHLLHFLGDRK